MQTNNITIDFETRSACDLKKAGAWVYSEHPTTEDKPDFRSAWTYQAKKMGRLATIDAYGGLLTENVVQHLARCIMYDRALVADAENLPLVLTVHDENVTEPEEKYSSDGVERLTQIMEDRSQWVQSLGIPIAAECWMGDRYRK